MLPPRHDDGLQRSDAEVVFLELMFLFEVLKLEDESVSCALMVIVAEPLFDLAALNLTYALVIFASWGTFKLLKRSPTF